MVTANGVRRGSTSLLAVFFLVAALLAALPGTARAGHPEPMVGSVASNGMWTVPGAELFFFGDPDDIPFLGDFDGNGVRTPGLYRPSTGLAYIRNTLDTGVADISWFMGVPTDQPLVGDFDGDGTDSFGVYRNGVVHLRNAQTTGVADVSYFFGNPGDVAFAGDFDGDGIDTVGVHRPSTGQVFISNSQATGTADEEFFFGDPDDVFVSGDWDRDGTDSVGIVRPSADTFFFRNTNDQGVADGEAPFDGSGMPVVPHQPLPGTVTLTTALTGPAEVPGPGDADGTGEATVTISGLDLSWSITVRDIADPTAAHIHAGTPDVSGGVVHSLSADGSDFGPDGLGGLVATGMLVITAVEASALAATPGAFYVNVHNADFAPGALRGNLM